jgi:hypothetical protein
MGIREEEGRGRQTLFRPDCDESSQGTPNPFAVGNNCESHHIPFQRLLGGTAFVSVALIDRTAVEKQAR